MSKPTLIHPEKTDSKYIIMNDNLVVLLGCATRTMIISSLIGLHDYFLKKNGDKHNGKFYQTHKQLQDRFPGILSPHVITDAFDKAVELGIMTITREKRDSSRPRNWFSINTDRVSEILEIKKDNSDSLKKRISDSLKKRTKKLNTNIKLNRTEILSKDNISSSPTAKKNKRNFVKNGKIYPAIKKSTPPINPVHKENPLPKTYSKIIVPGNNPIPADLDKMSADAFKKSPPGTKLNYNLADIQLYNELVLAGATNHRRDTRAYFNTMDIIHLLLSTHARNPYCVSNQISDDYKTKMWTHEEIVEVFKFYVKNNEKKPIKGIGSFIYTPSFGDTKSFSLLCIFHKKMIDGSCETLEGDAKRLNQELERMNLGNILDSKDLKRVVSLVGVYCNGYKVPKHNSTYLDRHIYAFTEYVESKIRIPSFKVGYIRGEKFIQQFVQEYKQRGILS